MVEARVETQGVVKWLHWSKQAVMGTTEMPDNKKERNDTFRTCILRAYYVTDCVPSAGISCHVVDLKIKETTQGIGKTSQT